MDCPLTRKHDSLFMLDFASKYVVQSCGAPEGVATGLMAVGVLAPLWLWALASAAHFAQDSQRTRMFSIGLSLATLSCWALLPVFNRAPPIAGCGPSVSFPCSQAAIVGYTMFADVWNHSNTEDATPTRSEKFSALLHVAFAQFAIVAVLSLGFAGGASVVAGVAIGVFVGLCLLWDEAGASI